jgi:hypothetical protein
MSLKMIKKLINFKFQIFIWVLGYLVIWLFATPSVAMAQEVSLSISPPITELTIQPGKSFNQVFTLKNDGAPVTVTPKIFPFIPLDKQGHAEIIEDKNSVDVFASWFYFDQSPVSLGTTGSRDFYLKITPPATAEEKDYYFTFIVEVQNDNNLGINNSLAQARIGANLLISVSKDGNPQKKASAITFSAARLIDSFSTLNYKVVIGNTGFSFFKPTGKITVDQIFGSTTVLNLAPLNVLVGGAREISCIQSEEIVPCTLPGKFLIGIYRSDLNFTIDDSGTAIAKQIYTIAFPFSVLISIIVIFIIYRIIKRSIS